MVKKKLIRFLLCAGVFSMVFSSIVPAVNASESNVIYSNVEDPYIIKYDVNTVVEGIPDFISDEMIIGALKCQEDYGYPASVTLAQIIQESGFGKYGDGLTYLAYKYKNLFGIKGTGTNGSANLKTWEQNSDGTTYTTTAKFRAYNSYTECIDDRADILSRKYTKSIDGVTDPNEFAKKIGKKWATDLSYSKKLISHMGKYDLYRFDRMVLSDSFDVLSEEFHSPCLGSLVESVNSYIDYKGNFTKSVIIKTDGSCIPTYAVDDGTVVNVNSLESGINVVAVDIGDGITVEYLNQGSILVEAGQQLEKGDKVGLSSDSGLILNIHISKPNMNLNTDIFDSYLNIW